MNNIIKEWRDNRRMNNTIEEWRRYSTVVIALEIKSLRKRKVLYGNLDLGGGVFGKSSESGDNTPTKIFLKKIVYKANTAVSKIF